MTDHKQVVPHSATQPNPSSASVLPVTSLGVRQVSARGVSCLAVRCDDWTSRRYPVTDFPSDAEQVLMGVHAANDEETVMLYGNEADDYLQVRRRRRGWTLLVGPARHFCQGEED